MTDHRDLPITSDSGMVGMVDITDLCRALIDPGIYRPASGTGQPQQPVSVEGKAFT